MIEDDLPTNLDYLDQAARQAALRTDRSTGETLRTWETPDEADARFASEVNGETVRMLYDGPMDLGAGYWESLPIVEEGGVLGDVYVCDQSTRLIS
jgi:autophagy-related protein 2